MVEEASSMSEGGVQPSNFSSLPDPIILKIFATAEAIGHHPEHTDYDAISDDTLIQLIDGFQKRLVIPLVCKRWHQLLAQPTYVWGTLSMIFHEIFNVQQTFIGKKQLLLWVSRRAAGVRSLQLDFDDWCRRYYQGCFSAIQASRTVTDMLQLLQNSLQQLKLSDSGYVVNRDVLRSISALHQLQHLQLFGMSSHLLVSSDLGLLTSLLQLRNLELSDSDEARPVVQMQHPHFFPVEVCSLAQLVRLHIQSPLVTHIDPGITRLRNLRTLMVNSCSIQQIPPFLTKLTQLDTIDFSDNDELAQNKIVEQWWPEELAGLTSLTDLNLSCCSLSSVPMCWTRLHRLRHLDLSTNAAHPLLMLPSMLTSCTSLECLKLLDLGLTFVPLSVCKMTSLRVLLLTNNELQTLPIEMAALSQLQDLDVGHNEFQTFPMVLTSLLSLERISMEGCTQMQITCSIKEMSRLTCLTSLVLTCDMSRVEPRWSADSTSRLVSLACSLDRLQIGKADMLRF